MKKCAFVILFLIQFGFAKSQNAADSTRGSFFNLISVSAGRYDWDNDKLNSQIRSWNSSAAFQPLNAIGINIRGNILIGAEGAYDAAIGLEIFQPQRVLISDSLQFRLQGWHLMTSIYGIQIINKDRFSLTVGPGIDWGKLNITRTLDGVKAHYNNPFISPFARIEMRYIIWKICLGVRASYRYEFTNASWDPEGYNLPILTNSKFSGFGLQAFIGYSADLL